MYVATVLSKTTRSSRGIGSMAIIRNSVNRQPTERTGTETRSESSHSTHGICTLCLMIYHHYKDSSELRLRQRQKLTPERSPSWQSDVNKQGQETRIPNPPVCVCVRKLFVIRTHTKRIIDEWLYPEGYLAGHQGVPVNWSVPGGFGSLPHVRPPLPWRIHTTQVAYGV